MSPLHLFPTNFSESSKHLLKLLTRHLPPSQIMLFHLAPSLNHLPEARNNLHKLAAEMNIPLPNCLVKWGEEQEVWNELKNEFNPSLMCSFEGTINHSPAPTTPALRVVVPVADECQSVLNCVSKLLHFSPLDVELFIDKSKQATSRLTLEAAKAELKDHGHTVRTTHSSNALPFALEIRNFARFVDAHAILTCEGNRSMLALDNLHNSALRSMKSWLNLPILVSPRKVLLA